MKRSYSDMVTVLLPVLNDDDPRKFKTQLNDSYKLKVLTVSDISKPTVKPIEEVEEPEEEDKANEIRMSKSNARMIQLKLCDTNGTQINAIELEKIDLLSELKPDWKVLIEGPVGLRCGNLMLEKKHVRNIEPPSDEDTKLIVNTSNAGTRPTATNTPVETKPQPVVHVIEDWDDDDDDDCIILD